MVSFHDFRLHGLVAVGVYFYDATWMHSVMVSPFITFGYMDPSLASTFMTSGYMDTLNHHKISTYMPSFGEYVGDLWLHEPAQSW
jgi:hypothetical protein